MTIVGLDYSRSRTGAFKDVRDIGNLLGCYRRYPDLGALDTWLDQ